VCVWAEFIMLATNRTEAVVNESRAELYMFIEGSEGRSWIGRVETCFFGRVCPYGKGNEMIYESVHIYVNILTLNRG